MNEKIFSFGEYWKQITYAKYHSFRLTPKSYNTHFIMIPIEEVVRELILSYHMNTETLIGKILFDTEWRRKYLDASEGIPGGFIKEWKKGTELFWGMKAGRREQLFVDVGGVLINEKKDFSIPLQIKNIREALSQRDIFPSFALCLTVLALYGIVCGGGYSQVDYFSTLKSRLVSFFKDMKEVKVTERLSSLPTDRFGGDHLFAFRMTPLQTVPVSFFDIFSHGEALHDFIFARMRDTTVAEAIDAVIPDIYKMITKEQITYTPHAKNVFKI